MPVVVTDAMDAWPAYREGERKWSIDWFAQTYGHVTPATGVDTAGVKEYISLGEYLAKVKSDEYGQVRGRARARRTAHARAPGDRGNAWRASAHAPRSASDRERPPPCSSTHDDPATHPSASVQLGKDKPVPYLRTWYFSDDIPELVEDFTPPPLFHSSDAFGRLPEDLRPPFRWQTSCKVVIYCLSAQMY
jgi:hypothetical protein